MCIIKTALNIKRVRRLYDIQKKIFFFNYHRSDVQTDQIKYLESYFKQKLEKAKVNKERKKVDETNKIIQSLVYLEAAGKLNEDYKLMERYFKKKMIKYIAIVTEKLAKGFFKPNEIKDITQERWRYGCGWRYYIEKNEFQKFTIDFISHEKLKSVAFKEYLHELLFELRQEFQKDECYIYNGKYYNFFAKT